MVAPKGLISCRRAENIHGSLKSDEAPSLTSFLWGGVMPNGHSKYHTPFFPARPWQRSFNPRQTVRDISSRLKSRRIKFYLLFTVPYNALTTMFRIYFSLFRLFTRPNERLECSNDASLLQGWTLLQFVFNHRDCNFRKRNRVFLILLLKLVSLSLIILINCNFFI